MAVTAQGSGTSGQTVGSELELLAIAVAGTFTAHVDLSLMAAGDVVEFRWYQIILTGGAQNVAYLVRRSGVQPTDDKILISVPIANELTDSGSLSFRIKQTKGTTRAFPWKVLKY